MSVKDGMSDEEWGAWGKTENATSSVIDNNNSNGACQNGFGSDDEIVFNAKSDKNQDNGHSENTSNKINDYTRTDNYINRFTKKGNSDSQYQKKFDKDDGERKFMKRNGQENYRKNNYQTNASQKNATDFRTVSNENETSYRSNNEKPKYSYRRDTSGNRVENQNKYKDDYRKSSPERNGRDNRRYGNNNCYNGNNDRHVRKDDDFRENRRNNSRRDDSFERGGGRDYNSRDKKISRYNREDSPDNRQNGRHNSRDKRARYRNHSNESRDDSSRENERRGHRRDRDYGKDSRRDDSFERRRDHKGDREHGSGYKRDNFRENRGGCRRDDSQDNRKNNSRDDFRNHGNGYKRDDSRENRRNYKRDDSWENRRNYKRDDSRENRRDLNRNDHNGYRRDDSRDENRRKYNRNDSPDNRNRGKKVDYEYNSYENKRKNSRDERDNYKGNKDGRRRNHGADSSPDGKNDENRYGHSSDYKNRERGRENEQYQKSTNGHDSRRKRNDDLEQDSRTLTKDFQRSLNVTDHDPEPFSSRTFTRENRHKKIDSSEFNEKSNTGTDAEQPPKRATFIPDDDQADYELHVNSGINFDNYEKIPVVVNGDNVPTPLGSFGDLELPSFLNDNIQSLFQYKKLTPIQKYSIPVIQSKRDLMACAQTGSGKTAAFLIPIIEALHAEMTKTANCAVESDDTTPSVPCDNSLVTFPKALIMAPTRELCRQIFTVSRSLCRGSGIKCTYLYGGIEMNRSRRNIQTMGCDILVATPGRLIHFLELVWISLRHLKFFVLDEADRMLDADGFQESVSKIYNEANCTGEDRTIQISMFSATFSDEIQQVAGALLKNYLFVAVGVIGSANSDVRQEVLQVEHSSKVNTAVEYIKSISDQKTLIFVDTKRMADFFGIKLGALGYRVTTIHGDRDQEQREESLNMFKSGRVNIMIATNVAARGLDIPLVDNVINMDFPETIDTYVHRIGRTGRCGNVGRALSFFDETKDICLARDLVNKLRETDQECPDWLVLLSSNSAGASSGYRQSHKNQSRDTRKNVSVNKYMEKSNNDWEEEEAGIGFGGRDCDDGDRNLVDYNDVKVTSEWLED